jgi:hypothetical protein
MPFFLSRGEPVAWVDLDLSGVVDFAAPGSLLNILASRAIVGSRLVKLSCHLDHPFSLVKHLFGLMPKTLYNTYKICATTNTPAQYIEVWSY